MPVMNMDAVDSENPHCDDPRFLQSQQLGRCLLRYTVWLRCRHELGEEHTRCKYQFFRCQAACAAETIEFWDDLRSQGKCWMDQWPAHYTRHMRLG
uniref:Uncharacterized protein n=1 Tax=Chromera velia CCMP2878 TaxID=1169474 RepID=A0A0G4FI54_9ALVE|eukprot:Cvel_16995.t1-p1 / transcript=Cvel_16995.t1 / gene=Cvel_16995 / organism=Chromera_velia_CCMP2878 / gene_product=hypothetical protein / transcript_product=hypothetical protein / location=Cvel_scaffold1335:23217-25164(-) / protein_length=95 / sequence_SO=supercontig / SO=protein_coding / is_pseudo=false